MATDMSLKLLVDKKRNRVLFAEAGKDFVDFLLNLFPLQLGTIVRLLIPTQTTPGSIGKLYSSVDNLDKFYIQPNVEKSLLLQPKIDSGGNDQAQTLLMQRSRGKSKSKSKQPSKPIYYRCHRSKIRNFRSCKNYVSNINGASCGCCGRKMTTEMNFVNGESSTVEADAGGSGSAVEGGESGAGGYVKEGVTYMVTDDLEVKPMSGSISSITFLKRFDVKDVDALEDRVVRLGMEKGVDLLRASLQSKSVLTDVFLHGKKRAKFEC